MLEADKWRAYARILFEGESAALKEICQSRLAGKKAHWLAVIFSQSYERLLGLVRQS